MWRSSSCSKRRRLNRPVSGVVLRHVAQPRLRRCALGLELARVGHVDPGSDHVRDLAVRAGQRGGGPVDQPQVAVARAPVELGAHGRPPARSARMPSSAMCRSPAGIRSSSALGRLQLGGGVARAAPRTRDSTGRAGRGRRPRRSGTRRRRAPHRGARCPQTRGSCRAERGPPRNPYCPTHAFHMRVRQTFSPHGPEAARRSPRHDRGAALPRPPGVGVGGPRARPRTTR